MALLIAICIGVPCLFHGMNIQAALSNISENEKSIYPNSLYITELAQKIDPEYIRGMQDYYVKLAMAEPGIRFNVFNYPDYMYNNIGSWLKSYSSNIEYDIEKVTPIIEDLLDGANTDYEKCRRIEWYVYNKLTTYTYSAEDSVYDTLMAGKGVCQEKANCFQFMCYLAGIPCIVLTEPHHAYTMMYIKEKKMWYDMGTSPDIDKLDSFNVFFYTSPGVLEELPGIKVNGKHYTVKFEWDIGNISGTQIRLLPELPE